MSKFFDATQRATEAGAETDFGVVGKPKRSELVESLVRTVEDGSGESSISEVGEQNLMDAELQHVAPDNESARRSTGMAAEALLAHSLPEIVEEEDDEGLPSIRVPAESEDLEEPPHPAYERIIQNLLSFRRTPRQSVILVASAVPREGASTVARNTAIALGRHRTERILLVDANLRAPSQHLAFQYERTGGLSDVIEGSASLTSAVKNDIRPGLSLLTSGDPVDSPPHLLTQSALQGVVMALTSLFDWVIIDGPPITTFPDAASLAATCGGAVLVLRAEKTRREVAEEARRVLEVSGVDVLGGVLNRRKYHIPGFIYRRL